MSDFDLDKSRWYNAMKISLAVDAIKTQAVIISDRASVFARFPFDPVAVAMLADTEDKLSVALDAIRVAREEYSQKRPELVAAE